MILAAAQLSNADYFILITYFAINLGIGAYFYRHMRGIKDYFSGSQAIPWWLSGISFYMSCFSVFAFVVYSSLAYQYGWLPITLFWAYIPATLLGAFVFAPRWRRARIDSPVEYLETRFNAALRQLTAWQGVPVKLIDDALKLVAIGIFVSATLDLPLMSCIFWSGLIILAYTFAGGLWAVAVTDFVQFVVMIAAVVVLAPLAIGRAGGLDAFFHNAPDGFFRPVCPQYGWIYVASLVFMFCLSFSSVHWQLIQRYTCVRNEKETRRVGLCVTALHLLTPIIMFTPAMAARLFLPADTVPEQVYPTLCAALLPSGLLGLIIAAMLSATMSMLSGDYNVCAGVLTNDVYRRLVRPQASQRELVLAGRLTTLLVGLSALFIAMFVAWRGQQGSGDDRLFRAMVQLFSVATAPVAIPMIAGLLSRRITPTGALAGFFAGLTVGLTLFILLPGSFEWLGQSIQKENAILFTAAVVSFTATVLVSAWRAMKPAEQQRVDAFMQRLDTPIGQLPEDHEPAPAEGTAPKKAISPFGISGFMVILVAAMMLVILPFIQQSEAYRLNLGVGLTLLAIGAIMILFARRAVRPPQ